MKASVVVYVIDINGRKTKRIYTECGSDVPVEQICNINLSIKICSLNIQQIQIPGIIHEICKCHSDRKLDDITRINIRWGICIELHSLQAYFFIILIRDRAYS